MSTPRALPDLRLAGVAAGTWLATIWALYLTAWQGTLLAVAAAAAAAIVAYAQLPSRARTGVDDPRPAGPRASLRIRPSGNVRPRLGRPRDPGRAGPQLRRLKLLGLAGSRLGRLRLPGGAVAVTYAGRIGGWIARVDRDALRWAFVAAAIGAACGAASTAGHVVVRERQPIAGLAAAKADVTVTAVVLTDPHAVGTLHIGPPTYATDLRISSVRSTTLDADVNAPIFVLASGPGWFGLLPGQHIVAHGRFEPSEPGELSAATMSTSAAPTLVGRPPWSQRAAGSLRAGLQRACAGLPGQVRGLLPGLIDGDTSHLDPTVMAAFQTTGMTHLVAVSGSNVVMILGAVLLAARWCRAGPLVTVLLCTVALIGFVILVRPSPSVLRAAAMGGISLIALATGRQRAALPSLAAVVIALILDDPSLSTDIGFSLSVFATAGLLLIAPHWRDGLRNRGFPASIAEALAVPAAAQVACSPLIAGFSGTVSIIAIPANVLAIPAVPAATIVGVAAAVIAPIWPTGAAFCAWLASWPARWLLFVAEHGAQTPAAVAAWPSGTAGALLLAGVLGGGLYAMRHRTARVIAVVSLVAALVGAVPVRLATQGWPPTGAVLVVCDVGQGDGMVLPLGNGTGVVVDSGPEPTAIDGCLRRLGIVHVLILFFTHFHADHVGGISGVLDGRRVDAIVTSPFPQPPEGYVNVMQAAAARHIPVSVPVPGQIYAIGPLSLTILGPIARLVGTRSDPNNNSLVMRADEDGLRILLTGDAEIEEQAEILAAVGPAALSCDVLKVPHHGSAYQDPAFLAAAEPRVGFVSVGAVNPYGLPSLATLDRLTSSGVRVLRTDTSGDLAALVVGGSLAIEVRGHPSGQGPP